MTGANPIAPINPITPTIIQKRHPFTQTLTSDMPGDSRFIELHCRTVLASHEWEAVLLMLKSCTVWQGLWLQARTELMQWNSAVIVYWLPWWVLQTQNVKWFSERCTLELTQVEFLICVVKVAQLEIVQPRIQCSQAFSRHLQSQRHWDAVPKPLRYSPKYIEMQSQNHRGAVPKTLRCSSGDIEMQPKRHWVARAEGPNKWTVCSHRCVSTAIGVSLHVQGKSL